MLPPTPVQHQSNAGHIRQVQHQVILANGPTPRNRHQQLAHPGGASGAMENGFVRQGVVQHRIHQPISASSGAPQHGGGRGGAQGGHDIPVRMLVNAKYIGALIGQGGSNIRQISKDSKARCVIDVSRGIRESSGTTVEKAVNVYGTPENCTTACLKILELVLREARNDPLNQGKAIEPEMKLLAHNNLVGRLIGKGGSTIKKIMEDSSCVVFLSNYADMTAFNMERTVTIRGPSLANISQAESSISAKLRVSWMQDMANPLFAMYGAGAHGPPLMNAGGAQHHIYHHQSSPFASAPVAGQLPMPFAAAHHGQQQGGGRPILAYGANAGGGQRGFTGGASPPVAGGDAVARYGGGARYHQQQDAHDQRTEVCHVWVPSSMVGALIGTKGANIRQIMRMTGAHIRIESPKPGDEQQQHQLPQQVVTAADHQQQSDATGNSSPGSAKLHKVDLALKASVNDRRVTITGPEMQQYRCQFWIYQRICEQGYSFFDDVRLCTEVYVPSKVVGRLIGRSGQNVRELQRYTGAQVRILEINQPAAATTAASGESNNSSPTASSGDGLTMARIVGNFNAAQAVQSRIRQLVHQAAMHPDFRGPAADSANAAANQQARRGAQSGSSGDADASTNSPASPHQQATKVLANGPVSAIV